MNNRFVITVYYEIDTIKVESASEVYSDTTPSGFTKSITIILPTELAHADYFAQLKKLDNIKLISQREILADDTTEFEYVTSPKGVTTFIELVKKHFEMQVLNTLRVVNLDKVSLIFGSLSKITMTLSQVITTHNMPNSISNSLL